MTPPGGEPLPPEALPTSLPGWASVGRKRLEHITRVVELISHWARAMQLPPGESDRWARAAWLHDALRDAPPEALTRWAGASEGPGELLHGPAAAARAAAGGESDPAVLEAVRFHSLGAARWSATGQALYCADYLEPGRRQEREFRAALAARYPSEPREVLVAVAGHRRERLLASGWPVPGTTLAFWRWLGLDS